jgi:polygalacturonase
VAVLGLGLARAEEQPRCARRGRRAPHRPHSVTITEFGAVGDGVTLNTVSFQNAVFYLRSFADKGGAQLYVPKGRWLTGSFNLTSHLTLFLEKGAVIVGAQVGHRIIAQIPSSFQFLFPFKSSSLYSISMSILQCHWLDGVNSYFID